MALLRARPDLAVPAPAELTTVATRAAGRASAQRAVDGLDAATLQVLEVMAVHDDPVATSTVSQRWGADARPQIGRLRDLALIWGGPRTLRVVRAAREALGPFPAGLGPTLREALTRRSPQRIAELMDDLGLPPRGDPETALRGLSEHLGDAKVISELLERAPVGAQAVLDRLTWGPPVGQLADADRPIRSATATSPVEWLLAHAMLAVADPGHVVLPREVALALRDGRVHHAPSTVPPQLTGTVRAPRMILSASVGAATDLVRHVEDLGRSWGADPPSMLRAGGLGVRELRRTGQAIGLDDASAALVVELAYQAGLVAEDGEADARCAPTPAFDAWRALTVGQRWAALSSAWLSSSRAAWLIGTRDVRDAPRTALSRDLDRAGLVELKQQLLGDLATAGEVAPSLESVLARLSWRAPRRGAASRHESVAALLAETATLGLTGAGAISGVGLALVEAIDDAVVDGAAVDVSKAAAALDAALPAPVEHVVIQADLTAVAPGPLEVHVSDELDLLADVESRGAATVYRFSPSSVRRAFDAGRTSEEILRFLRERSRTGVPQPLQYLIEDVAQRHARIRVGSAMSFVRAEDPAMLGEILADRRSTPLRLRRIAPTVLAADVPAEEVLRGLRELGLAPAAETSTGVLILGGSAGRRARRTPPRPAPPPRTGPPAPSIETLTGLVRSWRLADDAEHVNGAAHDRLGRLDRAGRVGTDPGPAPFMRATSPRVTLDTVRSAAERRAAVWIAYVDGEGRTAHRLVEPLVVDEGRLSARDVTSSDVTVVPVHRIIAVASREEDR